MKLTDTQRTILAAAALHPDHLAYPTARLPADARQTIAKALLKQNLVIAVHRPTYDAIAKWTVDGDEMLLKISGMSKRRISACAIRMSCRAAAAARFAVSASSAIRWTARAAREGTPAARKPGRLASRWRSAGRGRLSDQLPFLIAAVKVNGGGPRRSEGVWRSSRLPMWTPVARAKLVCPAQPYAMCLTDAEWQIAQAFLPARARCGRPRRWPMRALLDGVPYVLRTGCAWRRHLPRDFPPWQTTLRWFLRLARAGAFERLAHAPAMAHREQAKRDASPTAAVVDAQAARSGGAGVAGQRRFAVQPRRWVIKRTFVRTSRCRRLARGREATPSPAIASFVLAAAIILLRRSAKPL